MKLSEHAKSVKECVSIIPEIDFPLVDKNNQYHKNLIDSECLVVNLKNSSITQYGHVVCTNGDIIDDISFKEHLGKSKPYEHELPLKKGNFFLLWGHNNYYHMMFNWLPRLFLYILSGIPQCKIIIDRPLSNTQKKMVRDIFGESFEFEIYDKVVYENLYTSTFFQNPLHSPFAIRNTRLNVFSKIHLAKNKPYDKIFISRNNAQFRKILNEDSFFNDILKPKGFVNINLDNMTVLEQANLFRHAKKIVTMHGAALANLIFSSPGVEVVEIRNDFYTTVYWSLATVIGARKYQHFHATPIDQTDIQKANVKIELEAFKEVCKEFLG